MHGNAQRLASAVALTTSLTASTNVATIDGLGKHSLFIEWTPGTSGNVFLVVIDRRVQGSTAGEWTQEMTWVQSASAGGTSTNTRNVEQYQHTATGTTVVPLHIVIEGQAHELRIRYSESEAGSSTKGTVTAYVLSSMS